MELSNGFATQGAVPSKRRADMPNVPSISLPNIWKIAYAATVADI